MKHGMRYTKEYAAWHSMKDRCSNENTPAYKHYGGRGIKVCKRWMKFENFFEDMGICPEGRSLDRINNDGNYSPINCRWATTAEQALNKRTNHRILHAGEFLTVSQWAKRIGTSKDVILQRLKRGWSINMTLTKKVNEKNQKYSLRNGESHSLKEWSELLSIKHNTLVQRIKRGDITLRKV